ncbi:hypothetical protein CW304_21950 [Bacillus sp. UFRGS-B20]|nr:hypothetical protein CW304_21950 [Bacillus sp. UFRGS-B20]
MLRKGNAFRGNCNEGNAFSFFMKEHDIQSEYIGFYFCPLYMLKQKNSFQPNDFSTYWIGLRYEDERAIPSYTIYFLSHKQGSNQNKNNRISKWFLGAKIVSLQKCEQKIPNGIEL